MHVIIDQVGIIGGAAASGRLLQTELKQASAATIAAVAAAKATGAQLLDHMLGCVAIAHSTEIVTLGRLQQLYSVNA